MPMQSPGKPSVSRRHLVILPLLLLLCLGFFSWAAYTFLPPAVDTSRRQIVNDDYRVLTPPLAEGDEITQLMQVEGRLYGVNLNLTTFGRVPHGTLHLRLHTMDGTLAAGCDTDMALLLDNTFHRFLFDTPVEGGTGQSFMLSITATPKTAEDRLAFYQSEGAATSFIEEGASAPQYDLSRFSLSQNNHPSDGTLALQYVVRYAGASVVRVFSLLAALLTLLVLGGYVFLFVLRTSYSAIFLLAALVLGSVFLFLVPPPHGPNEKTHLATAYHWANVLTGQADADGAQRLTVRERDTIIFEDTPLDVFSWQNIGESEIWDNGNNAAVSILASPSAVPPLFYLPQILAVLVSKLLGLGPATLLLLGRGLNLLCYVGISFLAVRRVPQIKGLLCAVVLLPSGMQLAASFSSAALPLAIFYGLAAIWLYHRETSAPRTKQAAAAAAGAILFALLATVLAGGWPESYSSTNALPNASWLKTLLGGEWGLAAAFSGLNWLFLLALLGFTAMLAVGAPGQAPFSSRTRAALGTAAGGCLLATLLFALLTSASPSGAGLLPAFFMGLAALRGRNLFFHRNISRFLLFGALIAILLLQVDFFMLTL